MSEAIPAIPAARVVGRPFKPGQSGNPRGRPPRQRAAQRVAALVAHWRGLGCAADAETLQRAAELSLLAERLRSDALIGKAVDLDNLTKIENLAGRAVRLLDLPGAPRRHRAAAPAPTTEALDSYLRGKRTEAAAS